MLAESRDTILANCQQFRPTMLNGVPYFFDKVYRHCASQGGSDDEQTERLQSAVWRALAAGLFRRSALGRCDCRILQPPRRAARARLRSHGVFAGDHRLDAAAHIASARSGRATRGVEVKIADDGEILTRGRT